MVNAFVALESGWNVEDCVADTPITTRFRPMIMSYCVTQTRPGA
jgi:hypothetical protein